jgi:hypothetical protein
MKMLETKIRVRTGVEKSPPTLNKKPEFRH